MRFMVVLFAGCVVSLVIFLVARAGHINPGTSAPVAVSDSAKIDQSVIRLKHLVPAQMGTGETDSGSTHRRSDRFAPPVVVAHRYRTFS